MTRPKSTAATDDRCGVACRVAVARRPGGPGHADRGAGRGLPVLRKLRADSQVESWRWQLLDRLDTTALGHIGDVLETL
jgi:hypothetical protein